LGSTPALSVNAISAPSLNSNGITPKHTEKAFQTTGETLLRLPSPLAGAERAASFFSGVPSSSAQLAGRELAYNMIAGRWGTITTREVAETLAAELKTGPSNWHWLHLENPIPQPNQYYSRPREPAKSTPLGPKKCTTPLGGSIQACAHRH
jgi:hypothetical protein